MEIKIVDMRSTAKVLLGRVKGQTRGTWVVVGWTGDAVGVGDIRKTMPHERVDVTPGMDHATLVMELRLAAARVAAQMPEALAKAKPVKPKPIRTFSARRMR